MNDLILVSVDDHVIEPPDLFVDALPAKFRQAAPRVVRYESGEERWVVEGRKMAAVAAAAVVGRDPAEMGLEPMRYGEVRPGVYDVHARIDDMNANGVLASMNFASFPGFAGEKLLEGTDKELMLAVVQAYNDWHSDKWAAAYSGRFIPLGILPLWSIEKSIEELERLDKKGVRVICFPENPVNFKLPSIHGDHWDDLFKAIADRGMAVAIHIGTAGGLLFAPSLDSPADVQSTLINIKIVDAVADWTFSPLLRKFPSLRLAMSEGCMGWVPFLKERADAAYRNHRFWTHQDLGGLMPSDLIARHFLFCFHDDAFGVRQRHEVGIEQIAWESDYPHADTTWPKSPEVVWSSVKGLPKDEVDLMTHGNAMRFLQFDPFKHITRERATVGALRARACDVDVTPKSLGGRAPTRTGKVLSARDIARMRQEADSCLGEPVGVL